MKYEILDVDALGRIGTLKLKNKQMLTPNIFPVVHPYKNVIPPQEMKKFGVQGVFTNAYIMYQNEVLRDTILKKGVHTHLKFDGIIATDSGAFQQYMYNDSKIEIKADDIEKFQEDIGADFSVILDLPVQLDDDYDTAKRKVITTLDRAKENIKRRTNKKCTWFGPIHGAKFEDLLDLCVNEMNKLDFGVYAIGGLVKAFLDYRFDLAIQILLNVKKAIIPNKPIHMFGLGLPQFFSLAVACGCDLMDSAAYVLFAKENRYFTLSTGTKKLEELEEFPCHCPVCCEYTPRELKTSDEKLRIELLARHNLYLTFSELRTIRQAIREGNLWELVEQRVRNHPNLVEAAKVVKKKKSFFEIHEKIYKKHGRLYASSLSCNRPLIHRYEEKLNRNYRIPKGVKYLIILPELEMKGINSPSIRIWLEKIDNNVIIPRENLHISFYSEFYGLIPLELSNTFPMGQYEAIKSSNYNDIVYKNSLLKIENFFKLFSMNYQKCGVLIPGKYINQYGEFIEFSKKNPINNVYSMLKSKIKLNVSAFDNIEDLLQYFRNIKKI